MKSRIEQDHEQRPHFALILPRGAAYAPLPWATSAAVAVHSHPVTRNGHRRAHPHEASKGRQASGCRGAPDRGHRAPLPRRGRPRVTCNGGASMGGLNSPLPVTHPPRKGVSPVCWGIPLAHQKGLCRPHLQRQQSWGAAGSGTDARWLTNS